MTSSDSIRDENPCKRAETAISPTQPASTEETHQEKAQETYPWMKEVSSTGTPQENDDEKRTIYSTRQLVELQKEFQYNRYIRRLRRFEIAQSLGKTSENLVPESAEKMEKRKQDRGGSLKEGRNSGAS